MDLTLDDVLAATGGRLHLPAGVARPVGAGPVGTDTRSLEAGDWFVALVGPRFNGHDHLGTAAASGARGAVVDHTVDVALAQVVVDDTVAALQALGRWVRQQLTVPVVGLTGSNGKTTTRALIACALAPLGPVHQTVGNLNNHLGVPLTLLATPPTAQALVVEMGTSSPGEIAVLRDVAEPTVRLVTNVGPAHLLELGGLEGVAAEKTSLYRRHQPTDLAVVNLDDPYLRGAGEGGPRRTYGADPAADVCLLRATLRPAEGQTEATYRVDGVEHTVVLPLLGEHLAHNGAAAVAVATALGVPAAEAVAGLAAYEPVGRRARRQVRAGLVVLDDAYNANPGSVTASLGVLARCGGQRVAVLGDMLELGPDEARWHEAVVAEAGRLGLEAVALWGPRMVAAAGAWPGPGPVFTATDDPDVLAAALAGLLHEGDTVLFKGSRGARVERVLDALLARRSPASAPDPEEGPCSTT